MLMLSGGRFRGLGKAGSHAPFQLRQMGLQLSLDPLKLLLLLRDQL